MEKDHVKCLGLAGFEVILFSEVFVTIGLESKRSSEVCRQVLKNRTLAEMQITVCSHGYNDHNKVAALFFSFISNHQYQNEPVQAPSFGKLCPWGIVFFEFLQQAPPSLTALLHPVEFVRIM